MTPKYNVYVSDEREGNRKGFISQQEILEYVSEEEIFELVFGYKPAEYVYITSPLRKDRNAGCWFERSSSFTGKLRFIDYGNGFNKPLDCFDAVQLYFKLPNFYLTLEFIHVNLIKNKGKNKGVFNLVPNQEKRPSTNILFDSRPFLIKDANFWKRYGISRQNLIDDKVFAVKRYSVQNSRFGDFHNVCYDIAYCYTNFAERRKKLYFPFREGKKRFLTTCTKDDIIGLDVLPPFGNLLLITKAYKDWRVIVNNGKYSIGFQNEGMIPNIEVLLSIVKGWKKVIIWFDNDAQGIKSSQVIADLINSYYPNKATALWLPEHLNPIGISDPSDLYYRKGQQELQSFLKRIIIHT